MGEAERVEVATADGWTLGARVDRPDGPPRGVAVLLHAMMVDGRSLRRRGGLSGTLQAAGWVVLTPDLRGRGLSGPTWADGGRWSYDDLVRHDVPALLAAARALVDGPVVVLGHSLGGHVAAASLGLGAGRAEALVLLAANVWRLELEPSWRARAGKLVAFAAFEGLSRALGRFPARRLGVGPVDEDAAYVIDLGRALWTGRWAGADGRDYTAAVRRLELPVLSVLGAGDRWLGRADAAAAWAAGVGRVPPEVWWVGEGRYGVPHRPGHMGLVTDPRCAPLWTRLADWLAAATLTTAGDRTMVPPDGPGRPDAFPGARDRAADGLWVQGGDRVPAGGPGVHPGAPRRP